MERKNHRQDLEMEQELSNEEVRVVGTTPQPLAQLPDSCAAQGCMG